MLSMRSWILVFMFSSICYATADRRSEVRKSLGTYPKNSNLLTGAMGRFKGEDRASDTQVHHSKHQVVKEASIPAIT